MWSFDLNEYLVHVGCGFSVVRELAAASIHYTALQMAVRLCIFLQNNVRKGGNSGSDIALNK